MRYLCGVFIGVALTSFCVGIGFVSGWYPAERQGSALGIYGTGYIGQSLVSMGLGNGAVFKLRPEHFPRSVGTVSGLVGAAGGLGGFFAPLILGAIHYSTGNFTPGFVVLAIFALICFAVALKSSTVSATESLAHAAK
jgi:nitrate/nitrite transporter NarK